MCTRLTVRLIFATLISLPLNALATDLPAVGLQTPEYMDGMSFLDLPSDTDHKWRDYFLYVYYWEKNFPQTPTQFALRGNRYKYIAYYGLWDVDELFDLRDDPSERNNLISDPQYDSVAQKMEQRLYDMLGEVGGMDIPMNQPVGRSQNKRWAERDGKHATDFPAALVVEEPSNTEAH